MFRGEEFKDIWRRRFMEDRVADYSRVKDGKRREGKNSEIKSDSIGTDFVRELVTRN